MGSLIMPCFGGSKSKKQPKQQKPKITPRKLRQIEEQQALEEDRQREEFLANFELVLPVKSESRLSFKFDVDIDRSISLSEFDILVQKHSCDFAEQRLEYAFQKQPPKADMTGEITEILGVVDEEATRRILSGGDSDWVYSTFDLLKDKHHCDAGEVRENMKRAIEESNRCSSSLSMTEEMFFNDWPDLVLKYSLDSITKTRITSEDIETDYKIAASRQPSALSIKQKNSIQKPSIHSFGNVSLPPSTCFEVEPEEPFNLIFDGAEHPDLASCTSVGEFAHYIVRRAATGLDDTSKDFERFAYTTTGSNRLDAVSMAETAKTSGSVLTTKATGFGNQLMLDVLKEEDEIGEQASFFETVSQSEKTSVQTEVTNKSIQVKPVNMKWKAKDAQSLLDQTIDDYVVPDLSYWFEDEWDDICERNNLLMPRLSQITQKSFDSS